MRGWQPVAWYLVVTLGIPLLGGVPFDAAFAEHAATLLIVSGGLLALWGRIGRAR